MRDPEWKQEYPRNSRPTLCFRQGVRWGPASEIILWPPHMLLYGTYSHTHTHSLTERERGLNSEISSDFISLSKLLNLCWGYGSASKVLLWKHEDLSSGPYIQHMAQMLPASVIQHWPPGECDSWACWPAAPAKSLSSTFNGNPT